MKSKILRLLFAVMAACMLFSCTALAADSISVDLTKIGNLRGFSGEVKDGVLELEATGYNDKKESPAIFFPAFSVPASTYRYIKIVMKNELTTSQTNLSHGFYFQTAENTGYAEKKKVSVDLKNTGEFTEYTFDMGAHTDWSGTVTGIFYSIGGDVKGTLSIKSISFVEGTPIKRIELTDAEKITDIPETKKEEYVSKFTKSREYGDEFTDVGFNEWYYDSVAAAYAYRLVNGSSETTFSPDGTMTVAEAITLAARMHSENSGDGEAEKIALKSSGEQWYSNYVEYAKKSGFLSDGDFDSYDREITRIEMTNLFAEALPEECFAELNYVTHIPDVAQNADGAQSVYLFYNAGICMGNDIYGTFNPSSNITRSEVAAIVSRIADPEKRLDKDLAVKVNTQSAYYIVDDSSYSTRNTVTQILQSGWDYDNRGGMIKTEDEPPYSLSDISETEPTALRRTLTVQDAGTVTLQSYFKINNGIDGWYAEVNSTAGLPVFKMFTANGVLNVLENGETIPLDIEIKNGTAYYYRAVMNLEANSVYLEVNGKPYRTFAFANAYASDIAELVLGTTDEAVIDVTLGTVTMHCNYLVNDSIHYSGNIRPDWTVSADGDMKAEAKSGEYVFSGNTGKASISNTFEKSDGKTALDLIMLDSDRAGGAKFSLTSAGVPVVTFETKDGKMYANGKELRSYDGYMWYMVRLLADVESQTAQIKVSGKKIAEVPFAAAAEFIDGVVLSSENNGGKSLRIDDITVQNIPVYYNYPSEPKVPEGADDYYIGINICNLWRNGWHWGWDNISPYDENKPYLGWYDEGLPEVADWEIKFMAEHGIDFQLICWYHSSESPMKTFYGSAPKALFSGFMNAEYSDEYGKFALLWEASNGQRPSSLSDFKSRFVNFWVEYFFSDPRYMVIDNKLVMSVFGVEKLTDSFGSAQGVKEAFDYLRETVRGLGYDDIIIMACSTSRDASTLKNLAAMGIDAVHAYNWGTDGSSGTLNQTYISAQQAVGQGIMHNVPTVSTGFNNVAWAYTRHGQLSTENMEQVLLWIRDYALDKYEVTGEDDAWKKKFVMLSTWNEYGEGTYMMPSGLNGFGYLDTVRKVFTKEEEHTDDRPDNLQTARLGHLYPINREIIRPEGYYETPYSTEVIYEDVFVKNGTTNLKASSAQIWVEDGLVHGTASNTDPILWWDMPCGNVDASVVKQIKVWVDGVVGDSVQIYWQRSDDQTWTSQKGAAAKITQEGLNPVVINVSSQDTWKGTITSIRIDPITSQNSFAVEKVQLLGEPKQMQIQINNIDAEFEYTPIKLDDGDLLVPFYPDSGIGYQIGCAYTWDKVNKKLTLQKNGSTVVYTVGSDRATVNGTPEKLSCTIYLEDGLPMIPLGYTIEHLGGHKETYDDNGIECINYITIEENLRDALSSRVENQWEFEISGDKEGWTLQQVDVSVKDGILYGNNDGLESGGRYDPALTSPELSFSSSTYSKLVIKMKHDIKVEKTDANAGEFRISVYFKSSAGGLSEARTFKVDIDQNSGGEFKEYVINLSHEQWKGTISGIRVDPFNNVPGTFEIDYIRFEK